MRRKTALATFLISLVIILGLLQMFISVYFKEEISILNLASLFLVLFGVFTLRAIYKS